MLTLAPHSSASLSDAVQQRVWPMMTGLVHDLRQPLSVIDACADYLNLVLPPCGSTVRGNNWNCYNSRSARPTASCIEALLSCIIRTCIPTDPRKIAPPAVASTNAASAAVTY